MHFVETALRVLVAWNAGRLPATADLQILRSAFPSLAYLPADDLACEVIHDLTPSVYATEPMRHQISATE